MKRHLALISIILVSLVVHFAYFGHPKETVFDEVHFGKFVSGYFTHEYFFDIHPPLGKLIIAGAGYIGGFSAEGGSASGGSFGNIGDQFPDNTYLALRFLPRLAGTLLPVLIFLLLLELGFSRLAAMSAGLLVVFENALLVQSRFMLLDAFLLFFGFLAWWLYARYRNHPHFSYIPLIAISAGAAASVKWTGLAFLAIILLFEIKRLKNLIVIGLIALAVYFSFFALHFALLNQPGSGDAFMSQEFRDGKLNVFEKTIELNKEMYKANARLTAGHPYSSKWYSWPLMYRSIYYWNEANEKIYLLGNPVIWWASTLAMIFIIVNFIFAPNKKYFLIIGAYFLNLLPFIGIDRAMFLYHYFTALVIAIIGLVYVIDQQKNRQKIFAVLLLASIAAFILFAPLSYGLSLSDGGFDLRMWLPSWL